jgi:hypothetical protein
LFATARDLRAILLGGQDAFFPGRQSWLAGLLLQPGEIGCWIAAEPGAQGSGVAPLIKPGAKIPPAVSADVPEAARVWRMEPCRGGGDQAHLAAQHGRG